MLNYRIAVIDKRSLALKGNQRCPKENMFLCVFLLLRVLVHFLPNQQMENLLTTIEQKKRFQTALEWSSFMCRRELFLGEAPQMNRAGRVMKNNNG